MKHEFLIALLVVGTALSVPASAKTFKWVDDQGVTHYGETIPPEYASKNRDTLNKSGAVIKTQEVLSPEQRRAKEAESAKKDADAIITKDQKRYDKSLTSTYSSIEEIELSRTRNIKQVEARINSIKARLKMTDASLLSLQIDADARTKAGQKIPASMQDEMAETLDRANRLQSDLDKQLAEIMEVESRFDADIARYKELTGK